MNATLDLLSAAEADGVRLVISGPGELKVLGPSEAVRRWLPELKGRKPELISQLTRQVKASLQPYDPDPNRMPARPATADERNELAELIVALGEPIEHRAEALRLALLDPDAALECFRRIVKETT